MRKAASAGLHDEIPHSIRRRVALPIKAYRSSRFAALLVSNCVVRIPATIDRSDATITMAGSVVTENCDKKNASLVALPATWLAMSAAAPKAAACIVESERRNFLTPPLL